MAEKIKSINLIPHKGEGFLDQFFNWALTIGRLLVILTETLALGTFLYRFSIDMKIIDLHDLIKNQSAIVAQFKSTEDTARDLQARLAFAQKTDATAGVAPKVFADMVEMGRGTVTFRNLQVSKGDVKIETQASTSNSLNSFVNMLKNYPEIASVSIDSVENKTTSAVINMKITAKLNRLEAEQSSAPVGGQIVNPINISP